MNKMSLEEYSTMPVRTAVAQNALPAMCTMLLALVYNLADTFFIGMTHDPIQLAAISLTTPLFMMFSAVSNIFGMGGTSVISRAMGQKRTAYCKNVSSFCMWTAVGIGVILAAVFCVFAEPILNMLGASADTLPHASSYLVIVAFSAPFTMISGTFSKILTAEGQPKKAMIGISTGNLLNIILDPIFILGFHWDVAGAAAATLISNVIAAGYYLWYFLSKKSSLSIRIKDYSVKNKICVNVLSIGIPAALGSIIMGISVMVVNHLMAGYGDMALAGSGVATKVSMVTGTLCIGVGQGVQPLLGYCVGAKRWKRYKEIFRFSLVFAFAVSSIMTGLCYIFTGQLVGMFLTDKDAFDYAFRFSRILLTTSALFGIFYVFQNSLQAMGAAVPALLVNISRQGLIYIPMVYIMNSRLGVNGILWAQPVADILSLILAVILYYVSYGRKLRQEETL